MNLAMETVRLYWTIIWRYPRLVIGIFVSVPLTILINNYLPPLIVANVLNKLSHGNYQPHDFWASFGAELIGFALLILTGGLVFWRLVDFFAWRLEAKAEFDLANKVYGHLMAQSADFHANHFGGSLVSQYNKLLSAYIRMADTTVFQVLPLLASLLWACVILAPRAPLFTILLLLFSLIYLVGSVFISRKVRRLGAKQAETESIQTGYLADSVTNVMAIKSFAASSYEKQQFTQLTTNTQSHLLKMAKGHMQLVSYLGSATRTISALSLLMAVVGAVVFHANIAVVYLILNYTTDIVGQLFQFSNNSLRNYNRSIGDASEMTKILLEEPEVKDPPSPNKSKISKGVITFDKVIFTHNGADDALFESLSLNIMSGEKVGLVGHSGSGKTTITRLLLRFSDIDDGRILIDGQNIASITQDDLRSHIAYVPQEPLLFHRTIQENIAYGKPGALKRDVIKAAKKAYADEFITQLPNGYETLVGERGVKLSGGQRQRIAIARAILKDAPILVLDEATSALDSESERLIQAALWRLMEGRTAIVIAHRLSTVQKMDRIIVINDGKIIEQGSHQALLKLDGQYANLWRHQSGGFIDD
jgi:ATP-binding cassette, subfamily B, bacterial